MESCTSSNDQWTAEDAIGGNAEAIQTLREFITYPLLYSREAKKIGLEWPRGLLLYGPPGTGKTSLVRAVVKECGAHLTIISSHSVRKSHAGESEKALREAFTEAASHAALGESSVIFIDELDALCPRRDSKREQDVRVASQLFTLMDSNKPTSSTPGVVVVAATNRVDAIDPALRRYGRFDAEIEVTVPNEKERIQILELYTRNIPSELCDLKSIASSCNGYVGADLEALCIEAANSAAERASNTNKDDSDISLTMEDWKKARSLVKPSITRGVTAEVPKVTWEDIGGLEDLKKKLQQAVEWPLKHSAAFSRMGITPVRGILLHGPPGCSKTTLAKAAAHAANVPFFSLSGAELYSMYVGEGEALLRKAFQRARLVAPSIIFFDEADVVAGKRGDSSNSSALLGERLLSTLLTEMDGLEEAKEVLVLAATNRPYAIDAALMRPGRFDLVLYVPPPDLEARFNILKIHTSKMQLGSDVDLRKLAADTELFTGAELEGLCNEAGIAAMRKDMDATVVCECHFQIVKNSLKPSLTAAEIDSYSSFTRTASRAMPRHFESVLRMELDIQRFMNNADQQQFEFQHFPSSYLRLAAHRVAQHYGMQTMVQDIGLDGQSKIIVRKMAESKYPVVRLSEIPAKQLENDKSEQKFVLKPRPHKNSLNEANGSGMKRNHLRSVEERKEEYDRARARIFSSSRSFDSNDSQYVVPMDGNSSFMIKDENEISKNLMADSEKCFSIRDNSSSRVAIFRDREKDRSDPDYDRSYGRYARSISIPAVNMVPFNLQKAQPSFAQYDATFNPLVQMPQTQASLGYGPPSSPIMNPFCAATLNPTSRDGTYLQWPSPTMMYAHSYDQFRHAVYQAPFGQQPLSFDYSQNY